MDLKTIIIDYDDGIYAIDQQMVRAFLIVGKQKALLLDTGAIRVNIRSFINNITELPVEVILTHGDGDHIENLQDFMSAWINKADAKAVLSHEHCKDVELKELHDNDVFDIGGRKLKVLFMPGHTKGSICLLDEENKILFAGDTISYGPIFMFGERRDMDQYLLSLKRLQRMKDEGIFTTVYCCHNTCPISSDTTDELISCVEGIQDGSLERVLAKLPMEFEEKPLVCKYGKCAILIEGK